MLRTSGGSASRTILFLSWTITAAGLLLATTPANATSVAQKKHFALDQYHKALQLREALNGQPENERTSDDYEQVIEAFRKVYHVSPTSSRADAAVLAVAELLAEQARLNEDKKGFESAIGQYEFLCREYPGSKYRFEALLTIGQIYREDLDDTDSAKASFDDFVKRYPHHPLAEDAKAALKEMEDEAANPPKKNKNQVAASKQPESTRQVARDASEDDEEDSAAEPARAPAKHKGLSRVTSVRYWSTPDYTRIAIDLQDEVKYEAGRVPSPDRIFFDLHDSRLASELIGKSYDIEDGLLRKVRVAQYKPDVARVVLELDSLAEYSAFLLPNPYRLIIDLHGRAPTKQIETAQVEDSATEGHSNSSTGVPQSSPTKRNAAKKNVSAIESTSRSREEDSPVDPPATAKAKTPVLPPRAEVPIQTSELGLTEIAALSTDPQEIKATSKPTNKPIVETVVKSDSKKNSSSDAATSKSPSTASNSRRKAQSQKASATLPSGHEAVPTAAGDLSLVRALGLKVGKIVVDAGHGGHDTGTIGPNGLLEKDLVLDVALRLGKLLEQKLGADVVYTRQDDTFIPLETRTAIANQNQADLFISIHANSSPDPAARGVETYYLNFTSSTDALEVAARENAVSETSVHDLQDLVKKIALKDKIDESREFAGTVQNALYTGESSKNPGVKNRGVKKAPFIVLIGANMPSILAEISFVSNPTDERKLRTPEYRQRIAESLYRGIARYAQGLSGIKVASAKQAVTTGQ